MITLRPMTMADADKMLEWKNYPETRKFAIQSHDEIKREDHIAWLDKNIQYFHTIISCGYFDKGKALGAIRVQDDEVSIWVDQEFRNRNIATDILRRVAYKGMKAKIVDGNIASMRAFIAAEFLPVGYIGTNLSKGNSIATYYLFVRQ